MHQFKKIVKQKYDELIKERGELNLNILSSKAPNKDGNITALIMAGKEVYHRRIPTTGPAMYRYVLNIYFNKEDLEVFALKHSITDIKLPDHE